MITAYQIRNTITGRLLATSHNKETFADKPLLFRTKVRATAFIINNNLSSVYSIEEVETDSTFKDFKENHIII